MRQKQKIVRVGSSIKRGNRRKLIRGILMAIAMSASCLFGSLSMLFQIPVRANADGDFESMLAEWLDKEVTETDVYEWSFVICSLRTDGYPDEAIAGILGNMRAECGNSPYGMEGYYGVKTPDGVTYSEFEAGNSYDYGDVKPALTGGQYMTGHGLIQFSGQFATDMIKFSEECEFEKVEVTHWVAANWASDGTSYRDYNGAKHTCTMANAVGQMMFLIDHMNKNCQSTKEKLQNCTSAMDAARIFHDDIEKSAGANITERGQYGEEILPAVKICEDVIGSGNSDINKKQSELFADGMAQSGLWSEDQIIEICRLTEVDLNLLSSKDLSLEEHVSMVEWRKNIERWNEAEQYRIPRIIVMIIGILIVLYSVLLYIAFQVDTVNNFVEVSMLSILSFNKFAITPDGEQSTYNSQDCHKKVVTHKDMIIITLIGIGIGILMLSGSVFKIVGWVIYQFKKLTDG